MYFDEPGEAFDRPPGREIWPVIAVTAAFTLLFFVYTGPLLDGAASAAAALLPEAVDTVWDAAQR